MATQAAGIKELSDQGGSGTRLGTTTTDLVGFYGLATPIAQPGATTDLGTVLSNLGLRAAGTAYPITTTGAVVITAGTVTTLTSSTATITDLTVSNDTTITDAGNVILATTTGTKIGTATTQKLGFWNATPVVQPVGGSQAAAANGTTTTATTTNLDSGLTNVRTLLHKIRTDLIAVGIIKGAA